MHPAAIKPLLLAGLLATLATLATLGTLPAFAQAPFPSKPITMVVGFAPGGGTDTAARIIAKKLTENIGQNVIVENKSGAGGNIAANQVSKAAPDGYTIILTAPGSVAVAPHQNSNLPYDPRTDLTPITMAVVFPNVLVVHPSVPAQTTGDLIAIAKARPGQITFASGGSGAATHLAGELLKIMAGVEMTHVPYKGAGPATIDLISGQVTWMFGTILPTIPHVRAGKLRALAVSGKQRAAVLPEVPTVAEQVTGFEASSWYGVFAPAGTPADVIAKLNQEMVRALTPPEVRQRLAIEGTEVVAGNPEEFMNLFRAEVAKWARVVKQAGIRLE